MSLITTILRGLRYATTYEKRTKRKERTIGIETREKDVLYFPTYFTEPSAFPADPKESLKKAYSAPMKKLVEKHAGRDFDYKLPTLSEISDFFHIEHDNKKNKDAQRLLKGISGSQDGFWTADIAYLLANHSYTVVQESGEEVKWFSGIIFSRNPIVRTTDEAGKIPNSILLDDILRAKIEDTKGVGGYDVTRHQGHPYITVISSSDYSNETIRDLSKNPVTAALLDLNVDRITEFNDTLVKRGIAKTILECPKYSAIEKEHNGFKESYVAIKVSGDKVSGYTFTIDLQGAPTDKHQIFGVFYKKVEKPAAPVVMGKTKSAIEEAYQILTDPKIYGAIDTIGANPSQLSAEQYGKLGQIQGEITKLLLLRIWVNEQENKQKPE